MKVSPFLFFSDIYCLGPHLASLIVKFKFTYTIFVKLAEYTVNLLPVEEDTSYSKNYYLNDYYRFDRDLDLPEITQVERLYVF
jgi:hypothetical protein